MHQPGSKPNELKLYPLDDDEFVATMKIDTNGSVEPKSVQTVIILDQSGSMGDTVRRVSNEIIPLFLAKLAYKETDVLHFITFESSAKHYEITVEGMKSLAIAAAGGTYMAPAVKGCPMLFDSLDCGKPVRVLTISDGMVHDQSETDRAAKAFVDYLRTREFSINSQAVRLFTSAEQPDTKALSSLLQINNMTKSKLADIPTTNSNEVIATEIANLFMTDNLASGQRLTADSKVLLKFPWEPAVSQLTLANDDNTFWVKGTPSGEFKICNAPVSTNKQSPLTLLKFQDLMEEKLPYIVDHMRVLKVVGTDEANKTAERISAYFNQKETSLAQRSPHESWQGKKISQLLQAIAEDPDVNKLDSAGKADYLRVGRRSDLSPIYPRPSPRPVFGASPQSVFGGSSQPVFGAFASTLTKTNPPFFSGFNATPTTTPTTGSTTINSGHCSIGCVEQIETLKNEILALKGELTRLIVQDSIQSRAIIELEKMVREN